MVSFYKIVLVSILFLVSVSGVCAVDPDNNTNINTVTVDKSNLSVLPSQNCINDVDYDFISNGEEDYINNGLISYDNEYFNHNFTYYNPVNNSITNNTNNISNSSKIYFDKSFNNFRKDFNLITKNKSVDTYFNELLNKSSTPEKLKKYYDIKLNNLTLNIKNAFDTIDNDINSCFNKLFKNLETNMKSLENKISKNASFNLKNKDKTIKLVDNLIKNIQIGLLRVDGYNKTLNHYLDNLEEYNNLSKFTNDITKKYIIDVNNSQQELNLRIRDLNTLHDLFESIEDNLNYIKDNINLMVKLLKNKPL